MSAEEGWGFAPPAFKPEDAMLRLRRALRDLKLTERGAAFESRGRQVAQATLEGATLQVRLARRLALTPEFDRFTVASSADLTKLITEAGRRLSRWEQDE